MTRRFKRSLRCRRANLPPDTLWHASQPGQDGMLSQRPAQSSFRVGHFENLTEIDSSVKQSTFRVWNSFLSFLSLLLCIYKSSYHILGFTKFSVSLEVPHIMSETFLCSFLKENLFLFLLDLIRSDIYILLCNFPSTLYFLLAEERASGCFAGEKTAQPWAARSHPEGLAIREGKRRSSSHASWAHRINGCSLRSSSGNTCLRGCSLHLIHSIDLKPFLSGQYIRLVCFDQIRLSKSGWAFAYMHLLAYEISLHVISTSDGMNLSLITDHVLHIKYWTEKH